MSFRKIKGFHWLSRPCLAYSSVRSTIKLVDIVLDDDTVIVMVVPAEQTFGTSILLHVMRADFDERLQLIRMSGQGLPAGVGCRLVVRPVREGAVGVVLALATRLGVGARIFQRAAPFAVGAAVVCFRLRGRQVGFGP